MPHTLPVLRRAVVPALAAACALLICAPTAGAQDCLPPGWEEYQTQPVCNMPPTVSISPGNVTVSQPSVPVTMSARDHLIDGDTTSFQVLVDGQDVTSAWKLSSQITGWGTGKEWNVSASGTVALSETSVQRTVQVRLCDVEGCTFQAATYRLGLRGVSVTPDAGAATVPAGSSGTYAFSIRNTGTETATFQLKAECRHWESGAVLTGCGAPGSVSVAAGGTANVSVSFPAAEGSALTVGLSATQSNAAGVQDAGWVDVTVAGSSGSTTPAAGVRLVDLNWGPVIDHGQCVTVAVAVRAASQCGDLRILHPLPAFTTRGRTWSPVLVYSSRHANPKPIIYADVTRPAGSAVPTSIRMTVAVNGATYTHTWTGAEWAAGETRRIALQWNAGGWATGLYPYTVQVTTNYSGTEVNSTAQAGELAVVSRYAGPFGTGWWLAGWEQLVFSSGSRILWIGGDGSTRVYTPLVAGSEWVAQHPGAPADTLRKLLVNGAYRYVRKIRGGGEVHLDESGRHVRTVNRLAQVTDFVLANGKLSEMYVPNTGNGIAPVYRFHYNDVYGKLTQIEAAVQNAPSRWISFEHGYIDPRVTAITDPDNVRLTFGYGGGNAVWINRSVDRRGTEHRFDYNELGKVSSSWTVLGTVPSTNDIVQTFEFAEGKGLSVSVPLARTYTLLDGPRTDVQDHTYLWLTRWGAPRRIRDALGAETVISRADGRFPALATEVIAPNGLKTTAAYDARGRVSSSTVVNPLDDGQNATTSYTYDDRWDRPITITSPLVGVARTEYDPNNGNVLWQQVGDDPARRTTFRYYTSGAAVGQLRAMQSPVTAGGFAPVDSLVYDAQGNLRMTRSPLGYLTLIYRDALGRDTLVVTPTDAATAGDSASLRNGRGVRQRTTYDVMDRPRATETIGPAMQHVSTGGIVPWSSDADVLTVTTEYDGEGLPLQIRRWATPDTAHVHVLETVYTYDRAGRKISESDSSTTLGTWGYDQAGNLTVWTTPRGHQVRSEYDALSRLVRRVVPQVTYAAACPSNTSPCAAPYPVHPNASGGSLVIPEEWTHFRYDTVGRMVHAENRDAIVTRDYYRGGALRTDELRTRSMAGADFPNSYTVSYGYDVAGRVRRITHPSALAGTAQTDTFSYDVVTGVLAWARSRLGQAFTFNYDFAGRLTSTFMPGTPSPVVDSLRYDLEGRLTWRQVAGPRLAAPLMHDTLTYDGRGKLVRTGVWATLWRQGSSYQQWYSGSGMLIATDWQNEMDSGRVQEAFGMDAMGNTSWRRSGDGGALYEDPVDRYAYQFGKGRVGQIDKVNLGVYSSSFYPEQTTRTYDASGNVDWAVHGRMGEISGSGGAVGVVHEVRSRSYYSAEDRLRYLQQNDVYADGSKTEQKGVWEEYRYDPLGRRILTDSRRAALCDQDGWTCASATTRFVWAGDQLIWEIKGSSESPGETSGDPRAYGTVSYFHAGGIDRPLVITKGSTSIVPHQNWRGQFARGTYPDGSPSDCAPSQTTGCTPIAWPGYRTTAWHAEEKEPDIRNWFGGLVDGMRDASGQMYMRNRYYDPSTGQFTQTDPIGLAGGLNGYAFAAGDPVTYSDPYGLCAAHLVQDPPSGKPEDREKVCPGGLTHGEYYAREDGLTTRSAVKAARPKEIQLGFMAQENDYHIFRGCPANISHLETEGAFVGTWNVSRAKGLRAQRLVPRGGYRDGYLDVERLYTGTLKSSYGVTKAAGWVTCSTGQAHLESRFRLRDLTHY